MHEIVKVRSEYPPTVALSELALEIPVPPNGWVNWLAVKGITVVPDHIGRDSVACHHAKRLLDEQREDQLRRAALARLQVSAYNLMCRSAYDLTCRSVSAS